MSGGAIYCTSFCNFGHYMNTGRPIDHECYIIPPAALRVERDQGAEVALNSDEWRAFYATIDKRRTVHGRRRNTQ